MASRITAGSRPRHFIKEWRKHQGLTLDRLAEAINASKGHLSNIETYKSALTGEAAEAIARALKITADTLRTKTPAQVDEEESRVDSLEAEVIGLLREAKAGQRRAILNASRSIVRPDED